MNHFSIELAGKDRLREIRPLWEKLNAIHLRDSRHFKDHYSGFTFESRIEKFLSVSEDNLHIQIVMGESEPAGYCISSISGSSGEIDSLFIDEDMRGSDLGRHLVESAVLWMKEKKCSQIRVSIADGHESVMEFYGKMGFLPRLTVLELAE